MDLRSLTIAFSLALPALYPGTAVAAEHVVGQVRNLYVRLADGVYRQASGQDAATLQAGPLYAEVRFSDEVAAAKPVVFAPVPAGLNVQTGDLVRTFISGESLSRGRIRISPLPVRDRIVTLNAKYYTLAARSYGLRQGTLAAALQGYGAN